ncbi:DNA topoisomerase I [Planctomycetaceae bacterium SCGC AG-212-F19]|nr:DNA topoisomerase I [Planctomycetaceae bacterium SCGC AG-212-F19]
MAARKKKNLVIVESPTKAKTINKYLGLDYQVAASYGHVRDLPKGRRAKGEDVVGINIDGGWLPRYVVPDKDDKDEGKSRRRTAKDIISELKKEANKAGIVYLAPDPDREGEAIAWHLKEALGLDDERVRRVTFNEITKKAIEEAFKHPGQIDMDRVAAQEARRFLDRVVGYKLSPLLGKKVAAGLSAGRVQSVAVRLIVDREREIQKFVADEYWKIAAVLAPVGTLTKDKPKKKKGKEEPAPLIATALRKAKPPKGAPPKGAKPAEGDGEDGEAEEAKIEVPQGAYLAELAEWAGKKFEAHNEEAAQKIVDALKGATYVISKIEQKDRQERPQAPFTTSTLQQQASIRLRYSTKQTMMLAQRLYEGVELGSEGSVALITYMRTDSTRVSNDAITAVRGHIQSQFGKPYLPEKPNAYASGKSAQEAHEAIRPTDVSYTPEKVGKFLPHNEARLYELIYRRFVASQMTPAVFAVTNVDVKAAEGIFKAQGKILKFDGYRKMLPPGGKQEDALLPNLVERQQQDLIQLIPSQHFTQPPPRYNEASLVKSLEKEGIGRPSTYASIISTIQKRGYVEQKERRFYATPLGMTVTDLLVKHFPKEMDLKFTSHMEEELDQIEERKTKRNNVLNEFYGPFNDAVTKANVEMEAVRGAETGEICPKCGKPLKKRFSKKNGTSFLGCSGYPECDFTKPEGDEPPREAPVQTEHVCPTCGKVMMQRVGPRGPFLGCSGYPECRMTMNLDAEGKPVPTSRPTQHKCEKCGSPMVIREGRRGPFLACSGYPKCKNAKDVDADGNPIEPIDLGIPCEKCGGPMKVRRGRGGPFLGCIAYPKCRGTKQIPEELKEKVRAMLPAPAKKAAMPDVEVTETCPECDSPMKLRRGPRGYFLGCSKYPKCKGKREVSEELLEQVEAT